MMTPIEKRCIDMLTKEEESLIKFLGQLNEYTELKGQIDQRWIAIARTHFEEGFMAAKRAVRGGKRTGE